VVASAELPELSQDKFLPRKDSVVMLVVLPELSRDKFLPHKDLVVTLVALLPHLRVM
jgi:hypothetical protein